MSHLLRQQQTRFLCAAHIKCFIRLDTMLFLTQNVLLKCTCTCHFLVLSQFKLLSGDYYDLSKNHFIHIIPKPVYYDQNMSSSYGSTNDFGLLIRYFCFLILQYYKVLTLIGRGFWMLLESGGGAESARTF